MRNHGAIDFANLTLSVDLRGRVCGDGMCEPGLRLSIELRIT